MGITVMAVAACFSFLLLTPQQARAELIVNGSFELPTNPPFPNGFAIFPSIPGWFNPDGPAAGIEIQRNTVLGPGNVAQDGVQYVELNPNFPTAIAQDIPTVVGQQYLLSFWFSARPGTGVNTAVVTFEGNAPIPLTAGPVNTITWNQVTTLVTATDTTSTLTFRGLTPGGSLGTLLDNVSVTAIPEPTSFALLGLGGLVLGLTCWRRRVAA